MVIWAPASSIQEKEKNWVKGKAKTLGQVNKIKIDGFVKSPPAAYQASTPHFSGFARLASGAFYEAISLTTFYEIINFQFQ
ncbi:MAG: hypothetical protein NTY64_04470 [Deltaproteobacteria bacterium]|nr:hypothetical protein [Deltaproteobacteria bacterium]